MSTEKKRGNIIRVNLRQQIKTSWENSAGIENLRSDRIIAPACNHYGDGALMIAVVGIVMEQLVKLRRSSERRDNQ
jgi:hypothetical protein